MTTKITFILPAANIIGAEGCVLLGEFNNWNLDEGIYLTKQPDGSMTAEVELEPGDYQYRYLLSNGRWVNDNGEKVTSEISGYPVENCIVRVIATIEETKGQPKLINPETVKKKNAAKPKTENVKDDLTKVEGIGKKIEHLLNKNNIYNYKQLAKSTIINLKAVLKSGGSKFGMHNPSSWPKQAKLAASSKWEELESFQKLLKREK